MPTSGNRKQRYVLDIDDVVRSGFMTQANSEALIRGLNGSGGTVQLSVPMGGTNNGVFVDQELLKYDAATGKIMSAGVTSGGGGGGGGTVFVPWETGAFFSQSGVDNITSSALDFTWVDQTFALPANSLWSELSVMLCFKLLAGSVVSNMQLRLQLDATPTTGILQPSSSLTYAAGTSPDTAGHTWIARGAIPTSYDSDSSLRIRVFGRGNDAPANRTVITRLSYRGAVPAPSGGAPKGIPVFLPTPVIVYNTPAAIGWTTFNASPYVPDGASAVIVWAQLRENDAGSAPSTPSTINYRANALGYIYSLGSCMTHGGTDMDTTVSQQILPFDTSGATRSFQYSVTNTPNTNATIVLLGYIT